MLSFKKAFVSALQSYKNKVFHITVEDIEYWKSIKKFRV